MGVIGSAAAFKTTTYDSKFHQNGLCHFLEYCQHKPECCQVFLKRTKKHISRKYNHYFKHFAETNNLELIPSLVAYTLLGWPVERTDEIGVNMKHKVEDLEKEEIIFLDGNKIKLPFITLHEIYYSHRNSLCPFIVYPLVFGIVVFE
ncbi:3141_t:CDS:2, partial [Racocetra persica]